MREVHGDGYEAFLRSKIVAVPGDIGRPLCNFTDEQFAEFDGAGGLARRSSTAPAWCRSRRRSRARCASTRWARRTCSTLARKPGARLVHVSTCYVAGRRDGDVWEDEPIVGYFPRSSAIARD